MHQYSAALGEMDMSSFTQLVDGEAKHSSVEIGQEAAISRLCPISDAYDLQCDISASRIRAEEHVSAMLQGHDRRDDRAIFAGETIRYEKVGFH
jgi:hypothetical protein